MIREMIRAFLLVFIAEMGDKTQLLAMAFATRFPVRKVMAGIGLGALLNHGLAVALGSYLSRLVPINPVQMIAGAAFVGFALWTLKPDGGEEEKETGMRFGPVVTIVLTYFLGELGDKTQLTAITLAADSGRPLMVLAGTVSGLIASGALGIFIGKKLGDRIPELGIKILAASVFMFFGIEKLIRTVPAQYLKAYTVIPAALVLALASAWMMYSLVRRRREGIRSAFIARAKMLHDYYMHVKEDLDSICLGEEYCCACQGDQCAVGRSKEIIRAALDNRLWREPSGESTASRLHKPFSEEEVLDCLVDTLKLIGTIHDEQSLTSAHGIRSQMETILLGKPIEEFRDIKSYIDEVAKLDPGISERIGGMLRVRKPIEERLVNVGSRINNIYLVELQKGYLLIDTGYGNRLGRFEKVLKKKGIALEDIEYVFITHVHDDHVGLLGELLEKTNAKVILHTEAIERLKAGKNSSRGGCSSRLARVFWHMMRLFGNGDHLFQPVDAPDRYIPVTDETRQELEKILSAKIIDLPGHTKDSIGLLFDNKALFCGDAAMNGFPGRNNVIIWIEDLDEYKVSWNKMASLDFEKVYPSHGRPFSRERLVRNAGKLDSIRLF